MQLCETDMKKLYIVKRDDPNSLCFCVGRALLERSTIELVSFSIRIDGIARQRFL